MDIEVTSEVMLELQAVALATLPHEACGVLLGEGNRITTFQPATNVHPTPQSHFEIDPQALIDAHRGERNGGKQVLGYFHSHPSGDPVPSSTDRAMAAHDEKIWAIWGQEKICFWSDKSQGFTALSYQIT